MIRDAVREGMRHSLGTWLHLVGGREMKGFSMSSVAFSEDSGASVKFVWTFDEAEYLLYTCIIQPCYIRLQTLFLLST
jgi:hypothetical protein